MGDGAVRSCRVRHERISPKEHHMQRKTKLILAGGVLAVGLAAGTGVAVATAGGDDDHTDTPISDADLERATAAALRHTGGGRVTGTEVGDEESYYEVEVTLADGSQVDVQLDESFQIVGQDQDRQDNEGTED
jgi:uncharacterized membrane protein YkoI